MIDSEAAAATIDDLGEAAIERTIWILSGTTVDPLPAHLRRGPSVRRPLTPRVLAAAIAELGAPAREHALQRSDAPGWQVLLVEDNPVNRRLAKHHLERWGCRVDIAEDGREAVGAFERSQYDIVLMDIQIPILDGFEATRRIRMLKEPSERTPIIALTANLLAADVALAPEAGMDQHFSKPVDFEALRMAMESLV